MSFTVKTYLTWIIIFVVILLIISNSAFPYEVHNIKDIENMAFKQELNMPIDTSLDEAKFQPIDMHVEFSNPCLAKNEKEHSVRVCYEDDSGLIELESQIYDLDHSDSSHIKSCNLVFLIPKEANGKEKYYVLYDNSKISAPEYTDHLLVEDLHYYYEPISGQKVDFDYYKITEDGYLVYAVSYQGQLLGNGISQTVAKIKPNSKEFEAINIDQFASFAMLYSTDGVKIDYTGTSWSRETSKSILVDGNLMVRLRIESNSQENTIKTDNIYTYYYCPIETKRMVVNVNHEVLKTCEISGSKILDGTYASLLTFKGRSAAIEKINIGTILPSVHLYAEDNTIKEYFVPCDPTSKLEEMVLSTADDIDMGSKAWLSIDDSSTGKAHGLIFHSNTGFLEEEEDGVQVKSFVQQTIKLPGLEVDTGSIYATRNSYEKGGKQNTILSEGLNVNFEAEFVTFEKEGYEAVDKESEIYQKLTAYRLSNRQNVSKDKEEEIEQYALTIYTHLAPSFPLGSLLSVALGKNLSYIYAELYKNDGTLMSSGTISRLPLKEDIQFESDETKLLKKLIFAFRLFDWRNASFFKKISFPDLEPAKYIVKIYKENPFFAKHRQYIGFAIVDLKKDDFIHIYCRPQGTTKLFVKDQNEKGVEHVRFVIESNDVIIAETFSDINGNAFLGAPCYPRKPYNLKAIYNGFLVEEKNIHLDLKNHFLPLERSFSMEICKFNLKLRDTWGFPPDVEVNPLLTSSEMIDQIYISAKKIDEGEYLFTGLYPADYVLNMNYKSFDVEKCVSIYEDKSMDLMFPAEYKLDFYVMNSYGDLLKNGQIDISRGGKRLGIEIKENGKATFFVPPGEYELTIYSEDDKEIAKQRINVKGNKAIDIVTSQGSFLHMMVKYLGIALVIFSVIFLFWKKRIFTSLNLLAFALIIIALVSPWWVLTGDNGTTVTTTKTLLIPSNIVTLTSSSQTLGGEISLIPLEATTVLSLLSFLLIGTCLLIVISLLTKNRFRKTSIISSILSIIILIIMISIFVYTMSRLTEVGVGSFIGSGNLETTLPGIAESEILPCNWGPGIGFYLAIIAAVLLFLCLFKNKFYFRSRS